MNEDGLFLEERRDSKQSLLGRVKILSRLCSTRKNTNRCRSRSIILWCEWERSSDLDEVSKGEHLLLYPLHSEVCSSKLTVPCFGPTICRGTPMAKSKQFVTIYNSILCAPVWASSEAEFASPSISSSRIRRQLWKDSRIVECNCFSSEASLDDKVDITVVKLVSFWSCDSRSAWELNHARTVSKTLFWSGLNVVRTRLVVIFAVGNWMSRLYPCWLGYSILIPTDGEVSPCSASGGDTNHSTDK